MDEEQTIGSVVTEAVKNADVVSMLQKIVATSPNDEQSEEIREKIQNVLERYNNMEDSDKELFVGQLKEALAAKLSMKLKEDLYEDGPSYLPVLIAGLLIFCVLVFFGYKLYKSIKEKEKKREEKKKQKQMKKKK